VGEELARQAAGPGHDQAGIAEAPGTGLPAGSVILEQDFDFGSLYALRAAVSAHAAEAGMGGSRLYDVVTAAHELAANAVRHGAGRGHLRLWIVDGILRCEVSDHGRAEPAGDSQASQAREAEQAIGRPAEWKQQHGHGLWVVNQIADQFTINRGPAETTATAAFALGGKADAGEWRDGPGVPDCPAD
jgi:anti-sigma regulatory factor (Ser/Thr protein kinase)